MALKAMEDVVRNQAHVCKWKEETRRFEKEWIEILAALKVSRIYGTMAH